MSDKDDLDFNNMLKLAQFGADRHNERRQVVFRIFVSYTTLLIVIGGIIMKHWKDDIITSEGFLSCLIISLSLMFWFYLLWLRTVFKALIFDGRRRDFFLKKAEVLCHDSTKRLASRFSDSDPVFLNLGSGKSYKIDEHRLFKKNKPDIEQHIYDSKAFLNVPCKPDVCDDKHFLFTLFIPFILTTWIIFALVAKIL